MQSQRPYLSLVDSLLIAVELVIVRIVGKELFWLQRGIVEWSVMLVGEPVDWSEDCGEFVLVTGVGPYRRKCCSWYHGFNGWLCDIFEKQWS